MTRRKVIWHIGPTDPGTSFLAGALAERRAELAARGIAVPTGAWHEVEDQIWAHKGTSVLSTPDVSRADAAKIDLRLTGLRDLEVHLVLLARDLPTQVYAAWQAGLAHGSTTPLEKYAARVTDPERSHWQAEEFWTGRDLGRVLADWTRAIHPERVHVVAVDQGPDAAWDALLGFAGVTDLSRPDGFTAPALRAELDAAWVLDTTTRWAKLVADRGFDLHGALIAASTEHAGSGASRNDQLEALGELLTETTAEVERLRAEVTHLRAENERLDGKRLKHKRRVARLRAELSSPD